MFLIRKPSEELIDEFLTVQRSRGFSYSEVGATRANLPSGYTVDHNRVRLGHGLGLFSEAAACLREWRMFKLEWVELFQPGTPIEAGATIAVLVYHFGFWSLNACRVVYVFEEHRKYSFAYGTLQDHAEQGEERFSVEWSAEDDSVWYDILAFSRPKQWMAKVWRPLSRRLQRRFARDSMVAMERAVGTTAAHRRVVPDRASHA